MDKESFKQGFWYGLIAEAVSQERGNNLTCIEEQSRIFNLTVEPAYVIAMMNNERHGNQEEQPQ